MRRMLCLTLALAAAALAGCGGSPSQPPPQAPGMAGLERAVAHARTAVRQSQQDAARASATSVGP